MPAIDWNAHRLKELLTFLGGKKLGSEFWATTGEMVWFEAICTVLMVESVPYETLHRDRVGNAVQRWYRTKVENLWLVEIYYTNEQRVYSRHLRWYRDEE